MNQELFQALDTLINLEPEKFDMTSWETDEREEHACGTTRCLSGWAIALTTGAPIWVRNEEGESEDYTEQTKQLAIDLNVRLDVVSLGAALLDMNYENAYDLFYTNDEQAREFTRLAALGNEEGAMRVLDEGYSYDASEEDDEE